MKFMNKTLVAGALVLLSLSNSHGLQADPDLETQNTPELVLDVVVQKIQHFVGKAQTGLEEFFSKDNHQPYQAHIDQFGNNLAEVAEFKKELASKCEELKKAGYSKEEKLLIDVTHVVETLYESLQDMHTSLSKFSPSTSNSAWQTLKKPILAKQIASELGEFKARFTRVLIALNRDGGKLSAIEHESQIINPDIAAMVRKLRRQIALLVASKNDALNTFMNILRRIKC